MKTVISVWLDEFGNSSWIVGEEVIDDAGVVQSSSTLDVLQDQSDAIESAKFSGADKGLPVYLWSPTEGWCEVTE